MSVVEEMNEFLIGRITFPAVNYVLNRKDILGCFHKTYLSVK